MTSSTTCNHPLCGQPIHPENLRYKYSQDAGALVPFHAACSYAHPTWDVSKGCGSPFTTITAR